MMPHWSLLAEIPARSTEVFELLHNYQRRLEWDTLLQRAELVDGWPRAQLGATTICQGKSILGSIAMKTEYVSFNPPHVAAVKLINRPPFFETFAATIRHRDLGEDRSEIEYKYNFTARPSWLRWLLHPVMSLVFAYETRNRLQALASFFERQKSALAQARGF